MVWRWFRGGGGSTVASRETGIQSWATGRSAAANPGSSRLVIGPCPGLRSCPAIPCAGLRGSRAGKQGRALNKGDGGSLRGPESNTRAQRADGRNDHGLPYSSTQPRRGCATHRRPGDDPPGARAWAGMEGGQQDNTTPHGITTGTGPVHLPGSVAYLGPWVARQWSRPKKREATAGASAASFSSGQAIPAPPFAPRRQFSIRPSLRPPRPFAPTPW